uniref:Uncharacterized protein n=1 Tax=Megaselia scalaris TaxID=36166 RepID=T1H3S7_MEGSC
MATLLCDPPPLSSEGIFNYPKDLVLNCRSRKLTFYKANKGTCTATNIALGYEVNKKIIVHAESCFDLFEMKVKYLHFIARPLKSLISVENNVIQTENHEIVQFPEIENFEKPEDLKDRFNKTFPEIHLSQFYDYFPLVSEEMFPVV